MTVASTTICVSLFLDFLTSLSLSLADRSMKPKTLYNYLQRKIVLSSFFFFLLNPG